MVSRKEVEEQGWWGSGRENWILGDGFNHSTAVLKPAERSWSSTQSILRKPVAREAKVSQFENSGTPVHTFIFIFLSSAVNINSTVTTQLNIMKILLIFLAVVLVNGKNDKLKEVFRWNQVDYKFPDGTKEATIASGEYKAENNMPLGIEVWNNKVFVTVPRWKSGVPSSLNFVNLSGIQSPLLQPYPDWKTNNITDEGNSTKIFNTFRIRADECDRLWIIDSGLVDILDNAKVLSPPKILIYNLTTDELIREYTLTSADVKADSFFANIVVDVQPDKCDEAFAYLPDLGGFCLVVYSFKDNDSWRVNHHYFHFDPLAGNYNIAGVNFQWTDGLFGIALSPLNKDGFRTMYFHPLSSTREFHVSTRIVQNKTIASESYHEFKMLGSRGPDSQATTSFIDNKSGVLFYTQVNKNGIGCWNSKKFPLEYSVDTNALIASDNETMVFPNDLKVDRDSNLWVLTDRLPLFIYRELNKDDINFRILKAPVSEAIKGTVCEN